MDEMIVADDKLLDRDIGFARVGEAVTTV